MNTRTLLKAPYQVARFPLTVVQSQLMPRMSQDSPPRLVFERALGSFDMLAGRLLRDDQILALGSRLVTHADVIGEAVSLEADAAGRKQAAARTRRQGAREAADLREQAEQRKIEGVRQTATQTREAKREATDRVQTQAKKARSQSQSRAERTLAAAHNDQKAAKGKADARKQSAAAKAGKTITAAAGEKKHARTRRADAGQLSELADAKNKARKRS